ncbi:MAG: hypothetical protein NTW86_31860 [Candidatus Sumerlaeota bacterium]|nr:hypothetical protein [Candidatus Sumerlaeota bacterium]
MNRPVFARGKEQEQSLTQAASAPTHHLYTAEASLNFAVGDRIFIAEADGSELEFLGAVTATAPTYLTTALALRASKSATALLWRAARAFVWPVEPSLPVEKQHSTGIVCARALGGTLYSTRVAEPNRVDTLRFARLPLPVFEEFREWVEHVLEGALLDFTYVDERAQVSTARLAAPRIAQRQPDEQLTEIELEIAIQTEGAYV